MPTLTDAAFPSEVVEVYERNVAQPGASRAMVIFNQAYRYGWCKQERK